MIRVQFLLSTNGNLSVISLSHTGLRSSIILSRRLPDRESHTRFTFVCWSFPSSVEGVSRFRSDNCHFYRICLHSKLQCQCLVFWVLLILWRSSFGVFLSCVFPSWFLYSMLLGWGCLFYPWRHPASMGIFLCWSTYLAGEASKVILVCIRVSQLLVRLLLWEGAVLERMVQEEISM